MARMITDGDWCYLLQTIYFTKGLLATCFSAPRGPRSLLAGARAGREINWEGQIVCGQTPVPIMRSLVNSDGSINVAFS
jgi:hypothetical protein